MTIAANWDVKPQNKQTNKYHIYKVLCFKSVLFVIFSALKYFDMETTLQGSLVMGRVFVASNLLQNLTRDDVVFSFTVVATDRGTDVVQRGTASIIITVTKGTRDPNPKWDAFIVSTVQVPEVIGDEAFNLALSFMNIHAKLHPLSILI